MDNLPIILIEVLLVFGGVLAFGWWQLRSVRRDQRKTVEDKARAGGGDGESLDDGNHGGKGAKGGGDAAA